MRDIDRFKAPNVFLVLPQELATGWKIIVYYIEGFSVHPAYQARQHDRLRAIVDVGKWNGVRAA
jgi:hypothetical protein